MPSSVPDPKRCPECGEFASRRGLPISQSLWPKRSWIPAFVAILAAVLFGVCLLADAQHSTVSSGAFLPRLVPGPYTREDLGQLAAGTPRAGDEPGSLRAALLAATTPIGLMNTGATAVEVGFGPAPTRTSESTSRGWPLSWLRTSRVSVYRDPVNCTGLIPFRTDPGLRPQLSPNEGPTEDGRVPPRPRWIWTGGDLVRSWPPEETRGVLVRSFINLPRLLAPLAIGMLLIWVGFAAVRITNLIRRRRISPFVRRAIWLAGLFFMLAALAATLLVTTRHVWSPSVQWAAPRPVTPPSGFTYYVYDGFVRLPFMRDELAQMPATAASDQRIATAIVEAAGRLTAAPAADSVLAALGTREAFIARADMRVYGRRFGVLSTMRGPYTRRDDFGPSASISSTGPRIQIDPSGTLILRLPAANIDDSMRVRIDLGALAVVILGLWVVWGAARCVAALMLWRLGRRRRANGCCPACGYRLLSHRANTPT